MFRGLEGDQMISPRGRIDLLAETILAAPASRVTFLNLDLNTYRFFKIQTAVRNPLGWQARYYLYINGDEVKAGYRTEYIRADGAGVTAFRVNDPRIMDVLSGRRGFSSLEMVIDPWSYARWLSSDLVDTVGFLEYFTRGGMYETIIANVTQIDIVGERVGVAEAVVWDTGSYVRIYGLRP